jgi:hypothetical protein
MQVVFWFFCTCLLQSNRLSAPAAAALIQQAKAAKSKAHKRGRDEEDTLRTMLAKITGVKSGKSSKKKKKNKKLSSAAILIKALASSAQFDGDSESSDSSSSSSSSSNDGADAQSRASESVLPPPENAHEIPKPEFQPGGLLAELETKRQKIADLERLLRQEKQSLEELQYWPDSNL